MTFCLLPISTQSALGMVLLCLEASKLTQKKHNVNLPKELVETNKLFVLITPQTNSVTLYLGGELSFLVDTGRIFNGGKTLIVDSVIIQIMNYNRM